jgi:hypothetical protein
MDFGGLKHLKGMQITVDIKSEILGPPIYDI